MYVRLTYEATHFEEKVKHQTKGNEGTFGRRDYFSDPLKKIKIQKKNEIPVTNPGDRPFDAEKSSFSEDSGTLARPKQIISAENSPKCRMLCHAGC